MTRAYAVPRHAAREKAADRAAALAVSTSHRPAGLDAVSEPRGLIRQVSSRGPAALDAVTQRLGTAMGHDVSKARVHVSGAPSEMARALGARALTYGADIAFAPGQWRPDTRRGLTLLAHELAHAAMQAREGAPRLDAKTLDEEVDKELQKHATDPKTLDPNHPEYARTLQDYGHQLTHQSMTELRPEPKDAKAKAEWKKRFAKAELVAGRILSGSGAKGTLPSAVLDNDASALVPKLGK